MPIVIAKPSIPGFDNFESYSLGAFTAGAGNNWAWLEGDTDPVSIVNDGILDGQSAEITSTIGGVGNDRVMYRTDVSSFVDGTIQSVVLLPTSQLKAQATIVLRAVDLANNLQCRLDNDNNRLIIVERVADANAMLDITAFSPSLNTPYTLEMIVSGGGTIVTATVYDNEAHDNVLVTSGAVALVNSGVSGLAGISCINNETQEARFDNVRITPA